MDNINTALKAKYPDLIPDRFGFECGEGWMLILDNFFSVVARKLPVGKSFHLAQVKEKLGGLRIYYQLDKDIPSEIRNEISEAYARASARSHKTCEVCGKRGRFSDRRHLLTVVCEEHQVDQFGHRAIPQEPESEYRRWSKETNWQRYDFDLDAFVPADPPEDW